jgi:ABC-type nitrate/sulfonate/bicarbonate transport system substrate-binding protein
MKPHHFFIIIVIVSMVVISACVSQPQAKEPEMTTVKEEGYFAQQGINVELEKVQSTTAALPLVINGDIAVYGGTLAPGLINSIAKGAHLHIVADKGRMAPGFCNSTALMVRRDLYDNGVVRNASDLKGRKIMGSSEQAYGVFRSLALGNLTSSDVEIVALDYPSGVVAFKNGAVDAGILVEPYITQALNIEAAVVLVPAQDYYPDYPTPLYFGPAFLEKNPELGKRFMVAYLQGVKQYNEGKTGRNLEILQKYSQLDQDLLKQACWVPIAEDGLVIRQPVEEYMDWMYTNKKITQKLDEDQLFDMSYVTYANAVVRNMTNGG